MDALPQLEEKEEASVMYMVLFVLDDPEHLDAVLSAWSSKGLTGVTIVESTGLYRRQKRKRIPMR